MVQPLRLKENQIPVHGLCSPAGGCASDVPRTRPCMHRLDNIQYGFPSGRFMTGWERQKLSRHSQGKQQMVDQQGRSEIPRPATLIIQFTTCKIQASVQRHISVRLGSFRLSVTCDSLQMDRQAITHWELQICILVMPSGNFWCRSRSWTYPLAACEELAMP